MDGALEEVEGGTRIDVKVVAGAPKAEVPADYDEWRERLVVKTEAEARDGEANRELVTRLEESLDVESGGVRIKSGHRSSKKTLLVAAPVSTVKDSLKDGLED